MAQAMASASPPVLPFPPHQNPATSRLHQQLISATSLTQLKQLHAQILRSDLSLPATSLLLHTLSLSSISHSLSYSLSVFTHIHNPKPNLSNKLLRQFSNSREPYYALLAYSQLRGKGLGVDRFCFPTVLKVVSRVKAVVEGMEVHGLAVKLGFGHDPFVETGLVRMYAGCGRILDARRVFDKTSHRDVVTWSVMIDGYNQAGLFDEVLELFEEMKSSNVEPDEVILTSIITSCSRARNLNYGKTIHEFITQDGMLIDPHLQSALVNMYGSCGSMELAQNLYDQLSPKHVVVSTAMISKYSKNGQVEAARLIFDEMTAKDLVCWSAMISCYAESEKPLEALELFNQMQVRRIKPDKITMLSVISACTNLGALKHAKWIHEYVNRHGFGDDLRVNNALIDMYAKCGHLEGAREVFDAMPIKDVITWTSMITALAIHGEATDALKLFYQLKTENIKPNEVTFVSVLYACSHSGLTDEGRKIFASMVEEYNITPKLAHYGCMVDLLGRANLLREAFEIVEQMPLEPNVVIWGSLMAACRFHDEFELGEFAAKRLLELDPDHDGAYVFLSNIFAKKRRWEDARQTRILMKQKGLSKERGYSRIELNNEVQEFLMGARNHEQAGEIYAKLNEVVDELKQVGYAPNTSDVLVDLDEDEKEKAVLWHGEKLALCYGLIREEQGSCIRIVKNLRICEDCHTFMKLVSKVHQKNIIVRDRTRFHHYKDGVCSCNDYW